jgi:hypothetical protein
LHEEETRAIPVKADEPGKERRVSSRPRSKGKQVQSPPSQSLVASLRSLHRFLEHLGIAPCENERVSPLPACLVCKLLTNTGTALDILAISDSEEEELLERAAEDLLDGASEARRRVLAELDGDEVDVSG